MTVSADLYNLRMSSLMDEGTAIHFAGTRVRILDIVGSVVRPEDAMERPFRRLYLRELQAHPGCWMARIAWRNCHCRQQSVAHGKWFHWWCKAVATHRLFFLAPLARDCDVHFLFGWFNDKRSIISINSILMNNCWLLKPWNILALDFPLPIVFALLFFPFLLNRPIDCLFFVAQHLVMFFFEPPVKDCEPKNCIPLGLFQLQLSVSISFHFFVCKHFWVLRGRVRSKQCHKHTKQNDVFHCMDVVFVISFSVLLLSFLLPGSACWHHVSWCFFSFSLILLN